MLKKIFYTPFFIKLCNWEFWPFNAVYGPIYFFWILLGLRARSFFFFNTSNPNIQHGGFLLESKHEIYLNMPKEFFPKTFFFKHGTSPESVIEKIIRENLNMPLIGKPDIGLRGIRVQKIQTEKELRTYVQSIPADYLIQECIPYDKEAGIFYYRYPNKQKGIISGIVSKEMLSVTGNGKSTILELLHQHKRSLLQLKALQKEYGRYLNNILPLGEKICLVPYGNHSRGAKFIDETFRANQQLQDTFDAICQRIPEFYFGRIDIRFSSWEDLEAGKNFSIVEVNGAGSEPTHIYDPKHSIFFAWKEIIRHWIILYRISKMNHTAFKIPYMTTKEGLAMLKKNKAYVKMITN